MAQRTVGGRPHWNEGYDLFQRITNVLFFKIVFFRSNSSVLVQYIVSCYLAISAVQGPA